MAQLRLNEDLRPLADLESQAAEVVQQATETGRPIVLTSEGKGVAVLLSISTFQELEESAERQILQRAVEDAERDLAQGHWVDHSEIEAKLKEWAKSAA
jgi:prevent-host-death family protein